MKTEPKPPIRVLHVITRLIVGGAQENTMYTAAMLDKGRFEVDVVSGEQTGSEGSLIEEVVQHGVPLTLMPQLVRQVSPSNDLRALWNLYHLMRSHRYSIVHTHSSKAGILGRLAARLAGVPVIIHTVHGWSFHEHMTPRTRRMYVLLEKLAASLTDAMIVVTRQDIQKGLREGIGKEERYHLIRSAIPLEEFDPQLVDRAEVRKELGLPLDALVLGNIGRFSPQKNPLEWIRVAAKVAKKQPGARFLLVGDGPLRSQVEAALLEADLSEKTVLTGLRRDVPRMLAAMDVFLLTSLWEGLPRVIPQAMAMGIPVVANRADGTADAIQPGKTGYLCEPGHLDEMAAFCVTLLHDPLSRREMGARGQVHSRLEFDLRMMVKQIEGLYEELLNKKGLYV